MKTAIIILALCMASSVLGNIDDACSADKGTWATACSKVATTLSVMACFGALFLIVKSVVSN